MRLPALSVIIISQLVIWCIVGASVHGPMILLYPASWMLILSAFYFHIRKYPVSSSSVEDPDQKHANPRSPSKIGVSESAQHDSSKPQQVAATK